MSWRKEYLDLVLVPTGLLIMCCYHLYLLYRCLKFPETTIIGYENHCRRAWVERVLQVEAKERGLYLAVINSTITASTFLASTSLALSSIIGTWVGSSSHNIFQSSIIYGNTSSSMVSIKYISLLICFLVAFASFLQCKAVIRGSVFWSVGLRAIYFATNLLLWIFGPIPMLVASLVMVVSLNTLDSNSTPLHQFESASEIHTLFRRIGKEITAVEQKTVQHNRQHDKEGKESKSSDHTISPQTISG